MNWSSDIDDRSPFPPLEGSEEWRRVYLLAADVSPLWKFAGPAFLPQA
jgi:hypothetical protein